MGAVRTRLMMLCTMRSRSCGAVFARAHHYNQAAKTAAKILAWADRLTLEASDPKRIQLRRPKGWRMPENAVKVDRSTRWGNPLTLTAARLAGCHGPDELLRAYCTDMFRAWITDLPAYLHERRPCRRRAHILRQPRPPPRQEPRLLVPPRPTLPCRRAPRARQRAHRRQGGLKTMEAMKPFTARMLADRWSCSRATSTG